MADPSSRPPVISNARVFAIAGPAMLANLTTPLLGIVGTAVIGRLGEAHLLGGVAMSALVFDCLFWLFGFLRMGTVALTAQATGARDLIEQRAVLMRALLIAAVIGLLLIALQVPVAAAAYGRWAAARRCARRPRPISSCGYGRRPARSPTSPCSAG